MQRKDLMSEAANLCPIATSDALASGDAGFVILHVTPGMSHEKGKVLFTPLLIVSNDSFQ